MKRKIAFVIVLLAFTCTAYADWFSQNYWVKAGTKRTIAWTAYSNSTKPLDIITYELQILRMESGKTVYTKKVAGTQWEIKWNSPGHYVAYVRVLINGVQFGDWKNSLEQDSSLVLVGGEWTPRAWVIIVPTNY